MSTAAKLTATPRETAGKGNARALRREGQTPAVIYGHRREVQSLSIPTRDLEKLLGRISAGSTVIELALGSGRPVRTLIREVQRHPVKKLILHVDFQELVAGETITTKVPLRFHGNPVGVRVESGVLEEKLHEVNIQVDPANLPPHIDVDVTELAVAKSLHVGDLVLPPGVTVLDDPTLPIASVMPPRVSEEVEEAEAEAAAPAAGEPELIRKAKDEDEA